MDHHDLKVDLTLSQKTALRRTIDRQWSRALTGSEMKVLIFIFTMTVEWNKAGDRLKLEHFVNGIGKVSGTGLSKMTVRRALEGLATKGTIARHRTQYGYLYAINFDWQP